VLLGFEWLFPGKKLLFMGGEIGQSSEWDANAEVEWRLLAAGPLPSRHAKAHRRFSPALPAEPGLWQADFELEGF